MSQLDFDVVIIGAGVIGLAIGQRLAGRGQQILIIERADQFGGGASSRNTGCIHSGAYYPSKSLKAQLCLRGRELLYDHCSKYDVPYKKIGKVFLATAPKYIDGLIKIKNLAESNGLSPLLEIDGPDIHRFEPFLKCDAALLCPESGIVDSYALMLSLVVLGGNHGLTLATRSRVISGKPEKGFWRVYTIDESGKKTFVRARWVVNAAGIWATGISRSTFPLRTIPEAHPVKGSYLQLTGPSPVSRIIYPDLIPGKISERVDATPGIDGKLRFGPSVDAAASYEDYRVADNLKERLTPLIQRYLLNYNTLKLSPDYAGVRPKIKTPGNGAPDFIFDWADEGGWLDLWGMESPGLTSALAIAEHVEFLAGETGLI